MTVVFKIGGSLLTLPDLASRLRSLLEQRVHQQCLVIIGGGAAADVVRDWSRVHDLSDEASHWLAISSMGLNRELIESLLKLRSVGSREEAEFAWSTDRAPLLLDTKRFVRQEETQSSCPLPCSWEVTSDSLAAWVAECWPAEELVLVKSVPCPLGLTALEAGETQLVDKYFPMLSDQLPQISWCDLRSSQTNIDPWL